MFTLRLVCKDICNGLENIQVPVTNIIDIPPVAPEGKLHPSQNLKDYFTSSLLLIVSLLMA